jgi:hypothetical protein
MKITQVSSKPDSTVPYRPGQNDHFYPSAQTDTPPAACPLLISRRAHPACRRRSLGVSPVARRRRRRLTHRNTQPSFARHETPHSPPKPLPVSPGFFGNPPDPGYGYDDDPD